jgi:hypothetical protein
MTVEELAEAWEERDPEEAALSRSWDLDKEERLLERWQKDAIEGNYDLWGGEDLNTLADSNLAKVEATEFRARARLQETLAIRTRPFRGPSGKRPRLFAFFFNHPTRGEPRGERRGSARPLKKQEILDAAWEHLQWAPGATLAVDTLVKLLAPAVRFGEVFHTLRKAGYLTWGSFGRVHVTIPRKWQTWL